MRCDGFSAEDYGLYSLGSLDEKEASEISSHLERRCETCLREIRRSTAFWSTYGPAISPPVDAPLKRDWSSVLSRARRQRSATILSWPKWSAVAAALVLACGISIWLISSSAASERRHLETLLHQSEQQRREVAAERDRLADAARASASAEPTIPAVNPPEHTTDVEQRRQLQASLAETRRQLQQVQESLGTARSQAASVTADLNRERREASQLQTEVSSERARAAAAETEQKRAVDRNQGLQAQITQLEAERTRLLNVIQARERAMPVPAELISYLSVPGTRLVQLSGTEAAPSAVGYALIRRDNRLLLSAAGLPALPNGRTYQLWLMGSRGAPVVSGGTFTTVSGAIGRLQVDTGNLAETLTALAVTDEPMGGSRLPTGHKMLIGTVRS